MDTATITEPYVCPDDHKHDATLTCYHHHRCRCDACTARAIAYQARTRRLVAYGRWQPLVPATRARNHIRVLSAFGVGHRRVATLAGIASTHVADISSGLTRRVSPAVEARVLAIAVDASSFAKGQLIPATGVRRRLQALMRIGWSPAVLAPRLGMSRTNVSRLLLQGNVTVRTHEQFAALYEQLWNVTPPAGDRWAQRTIDATRKRAALAGWPPPLAWDDIDADPEPQTGEDAPVDEIAVELAVHGNRIELTRDERRLAVRQLHAAGHGDGLIAHMLLVSDKTIIRDREYLCLPANVEPTPLTRKLAA